MRCAKCGTQSKAGKKFCAECGSPLSNRCAKCGSDNAFTAKFCADCGASLVASAPASEATSPSMQVAASEETSTLEGERTMVTALFADIKGSMDLIEDLDPE